MLRTSNNPIYSPVGSFIHVFVRYPSLHACSEVYDRSIRLALSVTQKANKQK